MQFKFLVIVWQQILFSLLCGLNLSTPVWDRIDQRIEKECMQIGIFRLYEDNFRWVISEM